MQKTGSFIENKNQNFFFNPSIPLC